jgi:hypothetical protein
MKTLIVSKTALTVATVAFGAALSLPAAVIDFSTDPDIAGSWDNHVQLGTAGTATWDEPNEDLDLAVATGDKWALLSPTGATRGADESITLDVTSVSASSSRTTDWTFVGLAISSTETPSFTADSMYTFRLASVGTNINNGLWKYQVLDGTQAAIYESASSFSFGSLTMGIERNGDEYDFVANGSTLFTSSSTYTAAENDAMVNYHIAYGSGTFTTLDATVDNFGVIPEPGTYALLGGLFALSFVMVRRR